MTAVLTAKGLTAAHGPRVLFSGLDLTVAPGDVIGLVGANGAGKSTLLRTLAGAEPQALVAGTVSPRAPTASGGYPGPELERRTDTSVQDFLARRTGVTRAQRELDAATEALANGEAGADDVYSAAFDRWMGLGGADLEERAEKVSGILGLAVPLD